jgi:hypothetical protein
LGYSATLLRGLDWLSLLHVEKEKGLSSTAGAAIRYTSTAPNVIYPKRRLGPAQNCLQILEMKKKTF